ncbi:hypothetical protein [Micromonospora craniellae]|nr:hypothetical protein [Micromonospora craniellae]
MSRSTASGTGSSVEESARLGGPGRTACAKRARTARHTATTSRRSRSSGLLIPMLVLASAHAVLHTCWLAGWTVVSGAAARLLRTLRVRRMLDRLTGALLVGLGVRTAVG